MNSRLFLLVAGVGLSTYLMRLVPLALTSRRMSTQGALPPRLRGFLAAVGPSFVSVFLVYSILPASGTVDPLQVGLKVAALVPVGLAYYLTRNFGTAVLAGLAGYGILLFLSHAF
jgi:branched-subunit amino acid transport protein